MKKTRMFVFLSVICLFLCGTLTVFGQKGTVVEKEVKFGKGKSSITIKGIVDSRLDSHIFYLKAKAGQTLTVSMKSSKPLRDAHLCVNFPLTSAGGNEGACEKRYYKIKLPRSGKYEIYIEAIREPIPYTLNITIK